MKVETKKAVKNAPETIAFPPALMAAGVALVKLTAKTQLKFALLWADAILAGHDGQELISACYVAAGYEARDARGVKTNSSKFVAPALLFRNGKMTEKDFYALKMTECAPIFKVNGGMDGDGLNPDAWQSAREARSENAKDAEKPKTSEARLPEGDKPALSAFQILSAAISLRKSELNDSEIDQLVLMLRA